MHDIDLATSNSYVHLSFIDGDAAAGSPLSAAKLERCVQQYKTQIMQLDEKVHTSSGTEHCEIDHLCSLECGSSERSC